MQLLSAFKPLFDNEFCVYIIKVVVEDSNILRLAFCPVAESCRCPHCFTDFDSINEFVDDFCGEFCNLRMSVY